MFEDLNYVKGELESYKRIFQEVKDGIIVADKKFQIIWSNIAAQRITGIKIDDMVGKNPREIKTGISDENIFKDIWTNLLIFGRWEGEVWSENKKGRFYPEKIIIFSVKNDENDEVVNYVIISEDLRTRKKVREKLKLIYQKDLLTGLYNRSGFEIQLENRVLDYDGNHEFGLIIVDIINFKEINDSLGQRIGDKILKKCGEILSNKFDPQCLIGRYGSDEFILATSKLKNRHQIFEITKEIRKSLELPIRLDDIEVNIFVREGVSMYPIDGMTVDTLIRNTNIASFYCKETQENLVFYDRKMEDEMMKSFFIANNIKKGIEEQEFYLMYQPIFDIQSGIITGIETLARWENKDIGNIKPSEFIPVAEKTGNINILGDWILKEVSKDISRWESLGIKIPKIAINISTKQLENKDFCFNALSIFEYYNIRLSNIEFEVTESIMMGNLKVILDNIKYLDKAGISMSIDDFGTGYSSFGQLKNLPIKKIKIDKVFIDDIPYDSKGVEIFRSIISMGNTLKLEIVAEGIETIEQLESIKKIGCHLGQGYYYSRPLKSSDIEDMMRGS